jgi:hypothetical protein
MFQSGLLPRLLRCTYQYLWDSNAGAAMRQSFRWTAVAARAIIGAAQRRFGRDERGSIITNEGMDAT